MGLPRRGERSRAAGEAEFPPESREEEAMTVAEKKVVRQRLSVLELAEALGNVSEAAA